MHYGLQTCGRFIVSLIEYLVLPVYILMVNMLLERLLFKSKSIELNSTVSGIV